MRTTKILQFMLVLCIPMWFAVASYGAGAPELQENAIGETPPRLSFTYDNVSFWRPGSEEWSQAQVNTPLAPGDQLYTGPRGDLEVQTGSRAFVRAGPNSQLGLANHEPGFLQFNVTAGNTSFDLRGLDPGQTVEVDTPNAVLTIEHVGYYRVDVSGERTSFTTRRSGEATITSATGEAVAMQPSEEVVVEGTEAPQIASYAAPRRDAWDKWNYARTDYLLDALSARYVSPGIYGVDDLDRYGTWRVVPNYGTVWVPRGVSSGWAPYSTGSWVSDPYYGWTWVDTAPWGWAPYHYGRWVFVDGFWAWTPGSLVSRPAYAPALVAFFGSPNAGVSIGVGSAVGWVALGWGEPCVPWWGPESFRHRPWWGGWSGPRVVNNVVINRRTVVNVQEIHVYRNSSVRNAVVVVKENRFGRGSITTARIRQVDVNRLQLIRTAPRVTASSASYVPRENRGIQPPEKMMKRSVVATRPSHASEGPRPGGERKIGPGKVPTPEPRIVTVPRERGGAPELNRPAYGKRGTERSSADRVQPPSPPAVKGAERPKPKPASAPAAPSQGPPQRGPKVVSPSPQKSQASKRQPETAAPQVSPPSKVEGTKPPERAPASVPGAPSQSPPQRGPKVVSPSPQKSQASKRQPETTAPRASPPSKVQGTNGRKQAPEGAPRVLPGEPANRVSPKRSEAKPQERQEKERPKNQQKGEEKVPPEGPGK
jgi:hypothetical protein